MIPIYFPSVSFSPQAEKREEEKRKMRRTNAFYSDAFVFFRDCQTDVSISIFPLFLPRSEQTQIGNEIVNV
jgi:SET domain-containing protein